MRVGLLEETRCFLSERKPITKEQPMKKRIIYKYIITYIQLSNLNNYEKSNTTTTKE